MKTNFLIIALAFISVSTFGQSLEFTDKVLDRMVLEVSLDGSGMITKEMQQELKLTYEQFKTVEQVNKQRFQQISQAEQEFAGDPANFRKSYREINSVNDKALTHVLSDEQMARYMKLLQQKEKLYYSNNHQEL